MLEPKIKSVLVNEKPIDWMSLNSYNDKNIVVIIPGNPGIVSYYSEFSKWLFKQLDEKFSIWTISHSCHSILNTSNLGLESCSLQAEIESKVNFIQDYVPVDANLYLVGHSIGCYMILQALKKLGYTNINNSNTNIPSIQKSFFLFPTIERMKVSPNGKNLSFAMYFRKLIILLCYFLYFMPHFFKITLMNIHFRNLSNIPKCVYDATIQLVYPRVVNNVLNLAYEELETVKEVDIEILENAKNDIVFYFGQNDGWCPLLYSDQLVEKVSGLKTIVCDKGIEHAFVLESSQIMACKVAEQVIAHNSSIK